MFEINELEHCRKDYRTKMQSGDNYDTYINTHTHIYTVNKIP